MRLNTTVLFASITSALLPSSAAIASDDRPPLPLHGVEGFGGIARTYSVYLMISATEGSHLGMPSIGGGTLVTENGRKMVFGTITETF